MKRKSLDNYESIIGTSLRSSRLTLRTVFEVSSLCRLWLNEETWSIDKHFEIVGSSNPWWPTDDDLSRFLRKIQFSLSQDGVSLLEGCKTLQKENEDCVLTSFSLLRKRVTLARRVGVGHGFLCSSSASLALVSRVGSHRFARTIDRRDRSENEITRGGSVFLSLSSLSFFSRACRLRSFAKDRWRSGWRLGRVSRWNRRGPAYIPIYPPVPAARIVQGGPDPPRRSSHREGPLF